MFSHFETYAIWWARGTLLACIRYSKPGPDDMYDVTSATPPPYGMRHKAYGMRHTTWDVWPFTYIGHC